MPIPVRNRAASRKAIFRLRADSSEPAVKHPSEAYSPARRPNRSNRPSYVRRHNIRAQPKVNFATDSPIRTWTDYPAKAA